MRPIARSLLGAAFVVLCGLPLEATAASLSVAPTRVALTPDLKSGSIILDNTGSTPTTVQVETFAWTRGNSIEELEPTRGLLAVPAVFNLPAGARQVIRVATREASQDGVEKAYRLVISEVPTATPESDAGVRFALRLSLPVFITPSGARADPSWSLNGNSGEPTLSLRNAGSAHLHVRRLTVTESATGRLLLASESPSYVLPGATQSWSLDIPAFSGTALVQAETNLGGVRVELDG